MRSCGILLVVALVVASVAPSLGQSFSGQSDLFDGRFGESASARSVVPAMDRWKETGIEEAAAGSGRALGGGASGPGASQTPSVQKLYGGWQKELGGALPGGRMGAPGVRTVGGAVLPGGYVPGTSLSGVAPGEALGGGHLH